MKNSKLAAMVNTVAKNSFEKANEKKVIWIKDEDLLDNPLNDEDLSYTEDIEEHIKTEGFRYPITVTKFGVREEGKYYIISGHRSRRAGRNLGKTEFPCIIEDYASETEMYHAILTGNTRRNRDPLDIVMRYIKWEKYLDMSGYKGNRNEKIAKCLGVSIKQGEKYRAFSKIIPEFWELVRNKDAAKDGLYRLGAKSEKEQKGIYDFFIECNPSGFHPYSVKYENDLINAYCSYKCRTKADFDEYMMKKNKTTSQSEEQTTTLLSDTKIDENAGEDSVRKQEEREIPDKGVEEVTKKENAAIIPANTDILSEEDNNIEENEDFTPLDVRKLIEGHNDNKTANKEFKREEAAKYSDERLTEDDYVTAEKQKKEMLSHDFSKEAQRLLKISSTDSLKARDELIDIIRVLVFECISKGGECNKEKETVNKINKLIHSMTDELEWN
ncbi:MAG: ParB N-terminal domain-containing protein [Lachnospiraceae bacterium]